MPPDIDAIAETTTDFIEELSGPKTGKVQCLGATWNLQHLPTSVRNRYDMVLTRKAISVAHLETAYVYDVQDVRGTTIEQTSIFFWHPMLNNGVITNGGRLIQPLFYQEGF